MWHWHRRMSLGRTPNLGGAAVPRTTIVVLIAMFSPLFALGCARATRDANSDDRAPTTGRPTPQPTPAKETEADRVHNHLGEKAVAVLQGAERVEVISIDPGLPRFISRTAPRRRRGG